MITTNIDADTQQLLASSYTYDEDILDDSFSPDPESGYTDSSATLCDESDIPEGEENTAHDQPWPDLSDLDDCDIHCQEDPPKITTLESPTWDFTGGRTLVNTTFNSPNVPDWQRGRTPNSLDPESQLDQGINRGLIDHPKTESWSQAVVNVVDSSDFLIIIDQEDSDTGRLKVDQNLSNVAAIQSLILARNNDSDGGSYGKELDAITDEIGCGPYTFSRTFECRASSLYTVMDQWQQGVETLTNILILPPADETERRMLHFGGVGDTELLKKIFDQICRQYKPILRSYSINSVQREPNRSIGNTRFYMMWSLFPDEASNALGIPMDHPVFKHCMDVLESRSAETNRR